MRPRQSEAFEDREKSRKIGLEIEETKAGRSRTPFTPVQLYPSLSARLCHFIPVTKPTESPQATHTLYLDLHTTKGLRFALYPTIGTTSSQTNPYARRPSLSVGR